MRWHTYLVPPSGQTKLIYTEEPMRSPLIVSVVLVVAAATIVSAEQPVWRAPHGGSARDALGHHSGVASDTHGEVRDDADPRRRAGGSANRGAAAARRSTVPRAHGRADGLRIAGRVSS